MFCETFSLSLDSFLFREGGSESIDYHSPCEKREDQNVGCVVTTSPMWMIHRTNYSFSLVITVQYLGLALPARELMIDDMYCGLDQTIPPVIEF